MVTFSINHMLSSLTYAWILYIFGFTSVSINAANLPKTTDDN